MSHMSHDTGPRPGHDMGGGMHMHHHAAMFRHLFWWSLALALPTVACSPAFAHLLGYELPWAPLAWVSPVLGTVLYAWCGRPFLTGAVDELRARKPAMMTLVALGITVAFVASWAAQLGLIDSDLDFWWELALLVVIMLLGHWLEMRSLAQTSSALDSLAALLPDTAERLVDGAAQTVDPSALVVGDLVLVRPGARVPADGEVMEGEAGMDESMITGESATRLRGPEDRVIAGTVATDGALTVRVTAVGEDTALAGIRRLVSEAQHSSTRVQRLADRAAGWLFWYALAAAAITAVAWAFLGSVDDVVSHTITVLVIACPHALGLAIPLVVSISTGRAARAGILVSDRLALERMRLVTAVAFDKTGTLTVGEPEVEAVWARGATEDEVVTLAASAEALSEHPLGRAIVAAAEGRGLEAEAPSGFEASPALGVAATVAGRLVRVGGPAMLEDAGLEAPAMPEGWAGSGSTVLWVLQDGAIAGALRLTDRVRPESADAVAALAAEGIEVDMITGDDEDAARAVADRVGIDRVFARVRPEEKAERVHDLQRRGRLVAMVGDGVNDAPALSQADVGLAIGAGTDVAAASAGIVLAGSDPRAVRSVLELSRAAWRKMRQNLAWAAGYNLVAVPLATGLLGVSMPMSLGAILMAASTLIVAANAQLLRRIDLSPERWSRSS